MQTELLLKPWRIRPPSFSVGHELVGVDVEGVLSLGADGSRRFIVWEERAVTSGGNAQLVKPFIPALLAEMLRQFGLESL